jgi:2-polyprenyl-3-methyl-5-hydroxy-6-metoxy-1,4-benzoquinol methylase
MSEPGQQPPALIRDLFGWYSLTLLALGDRVGLVDALMLGPGTAPEIADRAGVDDRNTFEWLRALVAGGHATHSDGVFTVDPTSAFILGPQFPNDFRAVLAFTQQVPSVIEDVAEAMASGHGLAPGAYAGVSAAAGKVNAPTYRQALVDEWIAGVPGLADRLAAGGTVADIAAGGGEAAGLVATAFPQCRVHAYDIVDGGQSDLPGNVEFSQADAGSLPDDGPFDFIYVLDSFHHLGDPAPVLAGVRRNLAPGGTLMIVEANMSGHLDQDAADPFAVVVYACGLLYCLQESIAAGGAHSNADGSGWIEAALTDAGFTTITVSPSETGFAVITATVEQ